MRKDDAAFASTYDEVRPSRTGLTITPGGIRHRLRDLYLRVAGPLARFDRGGSLRCLYLHYVYDDQVAAFRRLLSNLRALGRFVTTDEVLDVAEGRREVDGTLFHVSFDDGFDNVHRNALRVLLELRVPACVFVPSALVDASEETLRGHWKLGIHERPTRTMDWSHVRALSDAGIEIGSHTRTHARLSDVSRDAARLREEVAGSKREIEDRLGRPCRYISWPYGTFADVDERALDAVREAGYEGCFSAVRGKVARGVDRWTLPRHHFEPEWPWSHVRYFAAGGAERVDP